MTNKKIKRLKSNDTCLNCHKDIGDHSFCPYCGQQNVDKQASLKDFFHDAIGDILTYDHKFFRSFIPLLTKPGYLTEEYNRGRRSNYILPLRLYIFVSVIFFLVFSFIDSGKANVNMGEFITLKSDTLVTNLLTYPEIDTLDAYKLAIAIPKKYDQITLNLAGKKWDNLLKKRLKISDSIRNVIAYDLFFKFEIDKEVSPETNPLDSLLFNKYLLNNYKDFSKDSISRFYNSFKDSNEVSRQFWHENKLSKENIFSLTLDVIKDPKIANYVSRELLINFKFSNKSDPLIPESSKDDSLQNSLRFRIGRLLEKQAKKISQNEASKKVLITQFIGYLPNVVFILLPIFALLLKLVYRKQNSFYINHLIFALHIHAVLFIYSLVGYIFYSEWVTFLLLLGFWVHTYFSLRNVYKEGKVLTFFKFTILNLIYFVVLNVGGLVAIFISFLQV